MGVLIYKTADKTVQTIAERNNITKKIDGMTVQVLDAIADENAGAGKATYRWVEAESVWVIIAKDAVETMSFSTEEKVISGGQVTTDNVPIENQIWGVSVVDATSGTVIADLRQETLTISGGVISALNEYDGQKIRYTYAYGSITSQITTAIEAAVAGMEDTSGSVSDFEGGLA